MSDTLTTAGLPSFTGTKYSVMTEFWERFIEEKQGFLSPELAEKAAARIDAAEHPVIVAGYAAVRCRATEALSRLADVIHIPVIYTDKAKGIISWDHRYAVCTLNGTAESQALLDRSDYILALGTREQLRELDAQCEVQYLEFQEQDGATLSEVLGRIRNLCREREIPHAAMSTSSLLMRSDMQFGRRTDFPMLPEKVLFDVRYALRLDDILVTDAGRAEEHVMTRYDCYHPDTCMFTREQGCAVAGAAAVKCAKPNKHVIAMTDAEALDAADFELVQQAGLDFTVLAWQKPGDELPPDTASCGVDVTVIERAAELIPALTASMKSGRMELIVCPVKA